MVGRLRLQGGVDKEWEIMERKAALGIPPTWWFIGTQDLLGVTAGFMIDANQPVSLSSSES